MDETVIRLEDRGQTVLAVQEWAGQGAAAVALTLAGMQGVQAAGGLTAWAAADFAVAAVLLAAILREVREARARHRHADEEHPADGGLGWVSILGGVALFVEWGARLAAGGKVVSPVLLTGIINVAQGLAQPWVDSGRARRRVVRVGDAAVEVRLSLLRRFRAPWAQVASVAVSGSGLTIVGTDARRVTVRRRRYANFARVAAAVAEGARLHGVAVTVDEELPQAAPGALGRVTR